MSVVDLSDSEVVDAAGRLIRLGDAVDRPTVIVLVRYYGCAPCRQQLLTLEARHDRVKGSGGEAIGIGPKAAYQAQLLMDRGHIGFRLLLDPDHNVAQAVGLGRQSFLRFVFDLRAWGRWLRGVAKAGQRMVTGGWWELPAILVVDADCRVRWSHLGKSMGDYPPIDQTLAELDRVLDDEPES